MTNAAFAGTLRHTMAPKGNRRPPQDTQEKEPSQSLSAPARARCQVTTKVPPEARDLAHRVRDHLAKQAESGMKVPIRVDLGIAHVWDMAMRHFAKEVGVL